ncbi:MAG: sigma-70 family RNA polymerase sigma factor [Gemmatimonadaceae bacterium]|nr:sigma-70 family RNA polymerase sigma factor [Gemmatimonadaceae bacterium]
MVSNLGAIGVYLDRTTVTTDELDRAAIRRYLEGEPAAARELVERYERPLFTVALRMLGNAQDAEDVTQAVFGRVFRDLHSYDTTHRFFSWVYRMTVNAALNAQRDRKALVPLEDESALPAVGGGADDALAVEEQVSKALSELKPDDRTIVVLRYFQSLSYDEIADVLGIPAKTVKSRLFTARERLRVLLLAHEG